MTNHFWVVYAENHAECAVFEGGLKTVIHWLRSLEQTDWSTFHVCTPTQNYLTVEKFLSEYDPEDRGIVPKFYQMDHETEEHIFDPAQLANGMRVLVSNTDYRASEQDMRHDWGMDRALERNRWCKITELKWNSLNNIYGFVGVYDDGSKRMRSAPPGLFWLVKKDSMTEAVVEGTERYQKVHTAIKEAFDSHEEYCCRSCNGGLGDSCVEPLIEKAAKQILGLL